MLRTITTKILYEKRWMLLFWSAGLFFTTWLTLLFYPMFSQGGLAEALQKLPPQLQALVGSEALKSVGGYIDNEILAMRLPLMTIIMSIALFVGLTAGNEERGTLQTLLALPVSRGRVMAETFLAGCIILAIACASVWLGLVLALANIHESYSLMRLVAATANLWFVTVAFGGLAFAVGAVTGRKGLTIGIASVVAFGSFFFSTFSETVSGLKGFGSATLFHYYTSSNVAVRGIDWTDLGVMALAILAAFAVGIVGFNRRDLQN